MEKFRIYADGEELNEARLSEIEAAMDGFVQTDTPLAVELIFVDEDEIREMNARERGVDKVTDVLSFPTLDGIKGKALCGKDYPYDIDEEGRLFVGSIAICVKRAKEQAEEYGHSYERELHYLLVHGIMHCLGYDHIEEADKSEMREKEELILGKLKITRKGNEV
jgi:probable rRNA maturation factor